MTDRIRGNLGRFALVDVSEIAAGGVVGAMVFGIGKPP
jgi:hypothetical protein